jgi:hypothetical protein
MRRFIALRTAFVGALTCLPFCMAGLVRPALAGPDACVLSSSDTVATCSGNQSAGLSFVGGMVATVHLQNLTTSVAPPSPAAGMLLQQTGANGVGAGSAGTAAPALTVDADGTVVITTHGASNTPAPAISVSGTGGNGVAGADAPDDDSNGGTGGAGGAGGAISIVNGGSLSSNNVRDEKSRADEFGLQSELTDASTNMIAANREKDIRAFLPASTDPKVMTVCGAFSTPPSPPKHCNDAQAVDSTIRDAIIAVAPNTYTAAFGTDTDFPFIDDDTSQLDVEIRTDTATQIYLSNDPLPEEMRGRSGVGGVVSVTSKGGDGVAGGKGGDNDDDPEPQGGAGGNGGAGGAITVVNNGNIASTGNYNSGILAVSQGGNAGNGGEDGSNGPAGVGGIGGAGGAVTVTSNGTITTTGVDSTGIYAQSVGGAGAVDGNGDNGSAGGIGGAVTVAQNGTITTQGYGAYGVFVQSVGGLGGGDGDNNDDDGGMGGAAGTVAATISGRITTAGQYAYGVFASSFGGHGGAAGDGDEGGDGGAAGNTAVTVSAGATIETSGDNAAAVYAQSKGGNGGAGGTSNAFWASAGGGGNGGAGGDVAVTNNGTLTTGGSYAYGILAQALGGSGGYGGDAAGLFAQSGAGGGGANAGDVTVSNFGSVTTGGTGSIAIFAQSVAGGGGDAGSAGGLIANGGDGGSEAEDRCRIDGICNNGGGVTVSNSGHVGTSGDFAFGIFAESVGGGGGNGGSSSGLFTNGGAGGAGGDGGAVLVTNTGSGSISVSGSEAYAIFAQSVGGGGGNGGDATSVGISTTVSIGGAGGTGGAGSSVIVQNDGILTASGDQSAGIYAQSVGGGGGNGGNASTTALSALTIAIGGKGGDGGPGGTVQVTNNGAINVGGDYSNGIFAQSVGGGGGNGGSASSTGVAAIIQISVAVGGKGGGGGDGDTVEVTNAGSIVTTGDASRGLFAQSVGGGGGNGGNASASSTAIGVPGSPVTLSAAIAVGGKGGKGGKGGDVTVVNASGGAITTFGDRAYAIQAQSVGGGGGNGGDATASAEVLSGKKNSVAISIAVGGKGGKGGNGGEVSVANNGDILTEGDRAFGIFAQSVGGGGGNGGDATASAKVSKSKGNSAAVGVAVGGSGGKGGKGKKVTVANDGGILTEGRGAYGILAQSVGGGGGNGGDATTTATTTKKKGSNNGGAVSVSVGGSGGKGGDGGKVDVSNAGYIVTEGVGAYGIFAQSVGGGGGNGGNASATSTVSSQKKKSVGVSVSVGGSAGDGGDGNLVTVANSGLIVTLNTSAYGIFAQSVGGGGGTGGSAASTMEAKLAPAVSVGGSGGHGGDGGDVSIDNSGAIFTLGDKAAAVFVQSVGGGGGIGGDASADSTASENPDAKNVSLSVSVGGSAGDGGQGGSVTVANSGIIATLGVNAYGVFAQSVGGGGGIGGAATASSADGSYSLGVSVGGSGGHGGDGGTVTVVNSGGIFTFGSLSYGVFAQSIGGGGGAGGAASSEASSGNEDTEKGALSLGIGGGGGTAGDGGIVTVTNNGGDIETAGFGAHGIFAQSVGGGGGAGAAGNGESDGKINIGAGFGGSGGASGDGGKVKVTNAGTILTNGDDAYGILAQSVGGGGGAGVGDGGAGNGNGSGLKSIGISVGGRAGASGDGGKVVVDQTGDIATLGTQSFGIFAESIGGGGGIGGAGANNTGGQIAVGGKGGAAGDGGQVKINLTGNISTAGDGAHGIFAQSVGGGGGLGGDVDTQTEQLDLTVVTVTHKAISVGVGVTGHGGGGGSGGAIDITSAGTIVTTGQNAYGILAQSVGGGGGLSGSNDGTTLTVKIGSSRGGSGTGGAISIDHTGSIYALGADSHGIFAQSAGAGPNSGGNITINVSGGDIVGGIKDDAIAESTGGVGVYIDQGATNTLTIAAGASVSSLSGQAITATDGDDAVTNSGTVTGDVKLGKGSNSFDNLAGGNFVTGTKIKLNGGLLSNAGTLNIGGTNSVVKTKLDGGITQSATGTLAVDVSFNGNPQSSDLLKVKNGAATVDGFVKPYNLYLMPGVSATVLKSPGGLVSNATTINTPTITYGLDAISNPNALKVTVANVAFGAPSGLTGNQGALAQYFQNIWNAGGAPPLAPAMGYLVNLGAGAYADALDHLMPTSYLGQVSALVFSGFNFTSNLMSCHGADGPYAAIREHECNWVEITGGVTNQTRTSGTVGYDESTTRFQAGRQIRLAPDWFLDTAVGYERAYTNTDTGASTTTDRYDGGVALKHEIGPWMFAAALNGGYAALDTDRYIGFPTDGLKATSNSSIYHLDGRLRASYLIEQGLWYLKPQIDFDMLYVNMPSFSESGAGALNLHVDAMSDVLFAVTPTLELGAMLPTDGYNFLRPFVSAGASFYSKDTWSVTASLEGAPSGIGAFTTTSETSQVYGNVSAGLDIFSAKPAGGLDVRLQYSAQFANDYLSQTGSVKFAIRF